MEGVRLILNDGTAIENGRAGFAEGFLWLTFPSFTMQDAISIVLDTSKTSRIMFVYGEMSDTYTGYTVCRSILQEYNSISVCMVRG